MTIKEQYISSIRHAQEASVDLMESFTHNMEKAFSQPTGFSTVDSEAMVDQFFDFWAKSLEVQREVSKKLLVATVSVRDAFQTQAESFGSAVRQQSELVEDAVHTSTAGTDAQVEQVADAGYKGLTKVELQDELAGLELPKSGNVEELRARLVANDKK